MSAWNFDSSHSKEYLGKFVPIQNSEIRYFLSNENETKYFLVASKGLGKSLLLKKKAVDLRQFYSGDEQVIVHPTDDKYIVEHMRMTALFDGTIDFKWLRKIATLTQWSTLWEYAIGFLVCRNEGLHKHASPEAKIAMEQIHKRFSSVEAANRSQIGHEYVQDYFTSMMMHWDKSSVEFSKLYADFVTPVLNKLTCLHVLFLDSPDESISYTANESTESAVDEDINYWSFYPEHWINFNLGFLDAGRRVGQRYGNIRVFGSLRVEALNAGQLPLMAQYEATITRLSYNRDEMKEIFVQNISLMNKDDLVYDDVKKNPISSFLGIDHAVHVPTGQMEDLFDAILRHTKNTPRDIVSIGFHLAKLSVETRKLCTETDLESIRDVIDKCSKKFLDQQRFESIPLWRDNLLTTLEKFHTNLVPATAMRQLSPLPKVKNCPLDFLYAQGIIGWLGKSAAGGKQRINFLDTQLVSSRTEQLPTAYWYAIHPIVYGYLRGYHGDGNTIRTGFLSSSKSIVARGAEITHPSIIRVEVTNQGGDIYLTGLRILKIPISTAASILLATLVYHMSKKQTVEFTCEALLESIKELRESCSWIPKEMTKDLNAIQSSFKGSGDETRVINTWLSVTLGYFETKNFDFQKLRKKSANRKTISMESKLKNRFDEEQTRLSYKKPTLSFENLELHDVSWSFLAD